MEGFFSEKFSIKKGFIAVLVQLCSKKSSEENEKTFLDNKENAFFCVYVHIFLFCYSAFRLFFFGTEPTNITGPIYIVVFGNVRG